MLSSFCAAEWLNVIAAFNIHPTRADDDTTIEMLAPKLTGRSNTLYLRFKVADPDGLHQVQLLTVDPSRNDPFRGLIGYKGVKGNPSTSVEFVTTAVRPEIKEVFFHTIDVDGNIKEQRFPLDITLLLPPTQVVRMPDPKLAAAVRQEIGNSITTHTLLNLTHLDIRNRGIKDLTGLEHAHFLTYLDLAGEYIDGKGYVNRNRISDFTSFAGLTQLRNLYLRDNSITDISVLAGLTHLRYLDLSYNSITDISVLAGLTHLRYLDLNANSVKDVSPLANLEQLRVRDMWIPDNVLRGPSLYLKSNPLSYASTNTHIPAMQAKGVEVVYDISHPRVFIDAQKRPPMYWVDTNSGTLHRLIGDKIENFLPNVRNAGSLAVDVAGGKLYWTEKTSKRSGRIRRANLDGTNVQLVKDLTSVPHSIAIDAANGKLYLTNSWGKVQRLNLDGSKFQSNLITDLESPKNIAVDVAADKIYWTEQTSNRTGKIQRANLNGIDIQLIKDLTSVPLDIVLDVPNGKLYWLNSWGEVHRMNLDGSNVQSNLITDLESPKNIAVDVADGKLYWTERGGISRSNLNGKHIENIVTGLDAPANIALGIMNKVEVDKVVSIPDANLAKAVRKALELGNNARITNQQLLKLSELDAQGSKIKNLTGLQHATQLTRLRLDRNQIRNLNPLSGLTRLKTLTLDENQISNVRPLTKLKQLDWLLIGGNPIKNAGVRLLAELKHLRGLSLYNSQISNITPLAKLTKLESLWLGGNQIRDVSPLAGLTNLRTLHLGDNRIRDVSPLGKLTELTELRLADNPIEDVGPLASLRNLEDVDIEIPPAAPSHAGFAPPEVTQLLRNYPNPFNPETWIPYQLAEPAEVALRIYAANGALVRTLRLGHQSAGYYTSRSRAAYWDGRNDVGEKVASGVYFYTLSTESTRDSITAGDFTATRKMLIRK